MHSFGAIVSCRCRDSNEKIRVEKTGQVKIERVKCKTFLPELVLLDSSDWSFLIDCVLFTSHRVLVGVEEHETCNVPAKVLDFDRVVFGKLNLNERDPSTISIIFGHVQPWHTVLTEGLTIGSSEWRWTIAPVAVFIASGAIKAWIGASVAVDHCIGGRVANLTGPTVRTTAGCFCTLERIGLGELGSFKVKRLREPFLLEPMIEQTPPFLQGLGLHKAAVVGSMVRQSLPVRPTGQSHTQLLLTTLQVPPPQHGLLLQALSGGITSRVEQSGPLMFYKSQISH